MLSALFSSVAFIVADAAAGLAASAPAEAIKAPVVASAPANPQGASPTLVLAAATTPAKGAEKTPVFSDLSDQAVADRALSYIESLTTLAGTFVQTAPSGAVASGKFYLRRPGQVRFDYDDPSPITIVATQGMVYVENSELETTDSYPLKKTPLRFLLSKKIDIGDATLKAVERMPDAVAITYASSEEETEGEITLVLSAPTLKIEQWAVKDAEDGVTIVALQGVTAGGAVDNRLFRAPDAGGAFLNE
ncbi:MAG: outer-membrane lipoprotein carrier protein LolA [Parvularculaceae bacterium]|nr:outer-membrane lipoprotein carrier protein LolA [Parvularculaceae bacterium]